MIRTTASLPSTMALRPLGIACVLVVLLQLCSAADPCIQISNTCVCPYSNQTLINNLCYALTAAPSEPGLSYSLPNLLGIGIVVCIFGLLLGWYISLKLRVIEPAVEGNDKPTSMEMISVESGFHLERVSELIQLPSICPAFSADNVSLDNASTVSMLQDCDLVLYRTASRDASVFVLAQAVGGIVVNSKFAAVPNQRTVVIHDTTFKQTVGQFEFEAASSLSLHWLDVNTLIVVTDSSVYRWIVGTQPIQMFLRPEKSDRASVYQTSTNQTHHALLSHSSNSSVGATLQLHRDGAAEISTVDNVTAVCFIDVQLIGRTGLTPFCCYTTSNGEFRIRQSGVIKPMFNKVALDLKPNDKIIAMLPLKSAIALISECGQLLIYHAMTCKSIHSAQISTVPLIRCVADTDSMLAVDSNGRLIRIALNALNLEAMIEVVVSANENEAACTPPQKVDTPPPARLSRANSLTSIPSTLIPKTPPPPSVLRGTSIGQLNVTLPASSPPAALLRAASVVVPNKPPPPARMQSMVSSPLAMLPSSNRNRQIEVDLARRSSESMSPHASSSGSAGDETQHQTRML